MSPGKKKKTVEETKVIALSPTCNPGYLDNEIFKGVLALRGYFGPLWSQKLKVVLHQFHPISLLEE